MGDMEIRLQDINADLSSLLNVEIDSDQVDPASRHFLRPEKLRSSFHVLSILKARA